MGAVKTPVVALVLVALLSGCSSVPERAYYPGVSDPPAVTVSHALYRAARAAGDDPSRYSFAFVKTDEATAASTGTATFYFSDGLARLPMSIVEPVIAHEVAHEVLGHAGVRRVLSFSVSAGFTVLGLVFPGAGLADFLVNPVIVRVFTQNQEMTADVKAIAILKAMGYEAPRRALARAITTVDRTNGSPQDHRVLTSRTMLAARLTALDPLEPQRMFAARTMTILER